MQRVLDGIGGVQYGFLLILFWFFRMALPLLALLLPLVWAGSALGLDAWLLLLAVPASIFVLAITAPVFFGSYFEIVGRVGLFSQRAGEFTPADAREIVMRNREVSKKICPRPFRWIMGLS